MEEKHERAESAPTPHPKVKTNSTGCSSKKSKIRQNPTLSVTVDVPKQIFQTICHSFLPLKYHHTFLIKVSTGCINDIENLQGSMKLYPNSIFPSVFYANWCFQTSLFHRPVNTSIKVSWQFLALFELFELCANRRLRKRWRTSDFYVVFTTSLCALGLKQLLISLLFQIIQLWY